MKTAACEPGIVLDGKTAEFVLYSVTRFNVRNLRLGLINIVTDVVGPSTRAVALTSKAYILTLA